VARLTTAPDVRWVVCLGSTLVLVGCPAPRAEPPPPAESLEIASAAPGALGALAAGTDAAPPAVVLEEPEVADPDEEGVEPPDAGAPADDAGGPEPETVPL